MGESDHIGARIRRRRLEIGMSQATLGKRIGVSRNQISQYEKTADPDVPRIDKLGDLSRALGISVELLVSGRESGFLSEDDLRALAVLRSMPDNRRADWFQVGAILAKRETHALPPPDNGLGKGQKKEDVGS